MRLRYDSWNRSVRVEGEKLTGLYGSIWQKFVVVYPSGSRGPV